MSCKHFCLTVVSLTISVHADGETLSKTASTALVPQRLVDRTAPYHITLTLADIHPIAVDAPLKKS